MARVSPARLLTLVVFAVVLVLASQPVPPAVEAPVPTAVEPLTGRAAAARELPPGGLVDSAPNFGLTQGGFSVSDDGAATYNLPLWVPQGRGHSTPQLALSYSSRGGNGLLGVGWSLSGLPSVTPCPRTIAQDGHTEALQFGAADAWCLGTDRLVAGSGSGSGPEREFGTEREMFARIIAYGMGDGVPDYFRIWGKDGLILTLGETADARLEAYRLKPGHHLGLPGMEPESTTRRTIAWAVNRIEDRNGNAATVEYTRQEGDEAGLWWAHMRPAVIRYDPNRRVEFAYEEERPDPIDGFAGGVHTRIPSRLTTITAFGGPQGGTAEKLREFRLSYRNDLSITRRSLLTEIKECDQDGVCKLPLPLDYSRGSYEFEVIDLPDITDVGTSEDTGNRVFPLDFDGDGKDDLLYPDANNDWKVRHGTGSGFGAAVAAGIPRIDPTTQAEIRLIDADLDGRMDVLAQVPGGVPTGCDDEPGGPPPCPPDTDKWDWRLYLSTGSTSGPPYPGGLDMVPDEDGADTDTEPDPVYFLDLDGNGTPDFLTAEYEKTGPGDDDNEGPWRYRLNDGTPADGLFHAELVMNLGVTGTSDENNVADLDGDGRDELLGWFSDPGDDEDFPPTSPMQIGLDAAGNPEMGPTYLTSSKPNMGDFNGDGLIDRYGVMRAPAGEFGDETDPDRGLFADVNAGTGRQASPYVFWTPPGRANSLRILDFNNDGRDDILDIDFETLRTWTDDKFAGTFDAGNAHLQDFGTFPALENGFAHTQPLDADGDGTFDIVTLKGGFPAHLRLLKRKGGQPDLLTTIGLSFSTPATRINYTTLADRGVHLPCATSYPLLCPARGETVVARHEVATYASGDSDWDTYDHDYADARSDLQGRGWLGFGRHTVTRQLSGAISSTTFDNTTFDATLKVYPYAQLPKTSGVFTPTGPAGAGTRQTTTYNHVLRQLGGRYTVERQSFTDLEEERPPGVNVWQTLRTRTTTTTYDGFGNPDLVVTTTAGGRTVTDDPTFEPDTTNWLIGLIKQRVTTGCDPANRCTTRTSTFDYYPNGDPKTTVAEPGQPALLLTTTTMYGQFGVVTSITSTDNAGQARTQEFEYGNADQLYPTATVNARGHRTVIETHSGLGVPLRVQDPNGVPVTTRYDKFGRLRETNRADGSFEHIDHLSFIWQLTKTTDAGGGVTEILVDPLGRTRERRVTAFDGRTATAVTEYDGLGRVARESRPAFPAEIPQYTTYSYDGLDRMTSVTAPDGAIVRRDYKGLETHTNDARGVHSYAIDTVDGQMDSAYEDDPNSTNWLRTRFEYGPFGETTKIVAPDDTAQTIYYDPLGRANRLEDPSSGTTITTHNAFGEVATVTDAENRITTFEYDPLGRVKKETSPDGVATNTWDTAAHGNGALAEAHSADGVTTSHTYDELGKDASTTWTIEGTRYELRYGYDDIGRIDCITYPVIPGADETGAADRLTVGHVYNAHGYLAQVKNGCEAGGEMFWTAEARNSSGQLERDRLGNGVVTTHAYQPATGLLDRILTTGPATPPRNVSLRAIFDRLGEITYNYDDNRNVTQRNDLVHERFETYHYDELNRLDGWSVQNADPEQPGMETTYAYEAVGNLKTETVQWPDRPEETTTYRYGEQGAAAHWLTSRNDKEYGYDRTGQQTSGPNRSVQYNTSGLPTVLDWGIGQGEGRHTEFAYDPGGARVLKRDDDQEIVTVGRLFEHRTPAGTAGREIHNLHNIIVDGRVVAQVNRVQAASGGPVTVNRVTYLHADLQGSTVALTNRNGEPAADDSWLSEQFYNPFGRRINAQNEPVGGDSQRGGPRQGYTGHDHDIEFGLINMKGRIYDPEARRFLTPDPIQVPVSSQSHNRYSYVQNNPATLTDPSGLFITDDFDETPQEGRGGGGPSQVGAWFGGDTSASGATPTPVGAPLTTHVPDMASTPATSGTADDDDTSTVDDGAASAEEAEQCSSPCLDEEPEQCSSPCLDLGTNETIHVQDQPIEEEQSARKTNYVEDVTGPKVKVSSSGTRVEFIGFIRGGTKEWVIVDDSRGTRFVQRLEVVAKGGVSVGGGTIRGELTWGARTKTCGESCLPAGICVSVCGSVGPQFAVRAEVGTTTGVGGGFGYWGVDISLKWRPETLPQLIQDASQAHQQIKDLDELLGPFIGKYPTGFD